MPPAGSVEVVPVSSARDRRRFLTFPWRVYRDDPLWVPPLLRERERALDPARGPFHRHGEVALFMARRGGSPVGTICAAEDRELNAARSARECIFGFFECLDDEEAAAALLDCAASWGRQRGLDVLVGPYHLDYEDSYGLLVEGRERPPVVLCGHTPAYYQRLLEGLGFVPLRPDNLAFALDLDLSAPPFRDLERIAAMVRRRGRITIRTPDFRRRQEEAARLIELLNRSLAHLTDFRPWDRPTLEAMLAAFVRFADPELVLFAEADGRTVGWLPGIPNLNEALIRANGLRRPWNALPLALALRRRPACLAVKSVLVLPEFWNSGVAALLFDETAKRAAAKGYRWVDLSLTSEDNPRTPALAGRMGARVYKRYRVYRRPIAAGPLTAATTDRR